MLYPSIAAPSNATHAELKINGDQFFTAIIDAFSEAKHFIYIELYLFESGKISDHWIDALIKCTQREVRVYLLLDGIGSRKLKHNDREKLQEAGVELVFYNPIGQAKTFQLLQRDHRKIIVIDNKVGYIGGAGVTDEFSPTFTPKHFWRETMCELKGEILLNLSSLFEQAWKSQTKQDLYFSKLFVPSNIGEGNQIAAALMPSAGLGRQHIKRSVLKHIRRSEKRIWVATAYFYPSKKLRRALKKAATKGIDVRLLVPGRYTDHPALREAGRFYYLRLLKLGVRIFEYEPRFLHMKCIICDDWVSMGSCNLDRWNQRWNLEANIEIDDLAFTHQMEVMFASDLANAKEIDLEAWKHRPFVKRFKSAFWAYVGSWLERFLSGNDKKLL